jgi:gamma-glutamyltranspeptidase/glutathione hydrolase
MHDQGLDIQAAIDAPRSFFRDGKVLLEPALSHLTSALSAAGHTVSQADAAIGGAHGVSIDRQSGLLTAGSDHRKDGLALAM